MLDATKNDLRLIEAGFPCHQVGAETQRERGASSALPPLYFLHVWWARRPLTPSRAAILASVLPADTDPDWFLRQLGIEKRVVEINGRQWTLTGKVLARLQKSEDGMEFLYVDEKVRRDIEKENEVRQELRKFLTRFRQEEGLSAYSETITIWLKEVEPLSVPDIGSGYEVKNIVADPAWASEKQALGKAAGYRFPGDSYGYGRAFQNATFAPVASHKLVVLDPTAGGGSIPFEALRLGHKVIANELNPVASVILHATLDYPARWGSKLKAEIERWGETLLQRTDAEFSLFFPDSQCWKEVKSTVDSLSFFTRVNRRFDPANISMEKGHYQESHDPDNSTPYFR